MSRRRRDDTKLLPTPAAQGAAAGTLVVAAGTARERWVPLGERTVIGSGSQSDLVLDDAAVSRTHCEIFREGAALRIRDLGSRNGTLVGGIAVTDALLANGCSLRVGETPMFYLEAASESPDLESAPTHFGEALGVSAEMRRVFHLLGRIAPTDLTVTLLGETGTGKDVLARALHSHSQRGGGPFVVFDAGAAAPTLIESRLFGHAKGAFTGAIADQKGQFEAAEGGTLFLDELGELALDLQPKLLRALEGRTVVRLGETAERAVDVRVIAATHRDLPTRVAEGHFREDLYFRLGGAIVVIPPLRDRREDIPVLAEAFAAALSPPVTLAADALALLKEQRWPGNVRELKNAVAHAAAIAASDVLQVGDFVSLGAPPTRRLSTLDGVPLAGKSLDAVEASAIRQTLRRCGGNKTQAAKELGIAVSTLYEKLKKYEL